MYFHKQLAWFVCKKCGNVVKCNHSPDYGTCPKDGCGHDWGYVGEFGNKIYSCKKCGITVNTDRSPSQPDCYVGPGAHEWAYIGETENSKSSSTYSSSSSSSSSYSSSSSDSDGGALGVHLVLLIAVLAAIGVFLSFLFSKIVIGLEYLSSTPNPLCVAASLLITLGGMFLAAFVANRRKSRLGYEFPAKRIKNLAIFTGLSILLSASLFAGTNFSYAYRGAFPYVFMSLLALFAIFLVFRLKAMGLVIISLAFVFFEIYVSKRYDDPWGCLFALIPFAAQVWLGSYYTKNNFFFTNFRSMVHRPFSFSDLFYKGFWLESWLPFLAILAVSFYYIKNGVEYMIQILFAK